MSLAKNGFMMLEELKVASNNYPSEDRMRKGPVAIAECIEEIPCNPCESACRFGAILVGECITNVPVIDREKCTGCGVCVAHCSGMAIFVMDKSYSDTVGSVAFPYEYPHLPQVGDRVDAVDRAGRIVCKGCIKRILMPASFDKTHVVTVEVPIEMVEIVRGIAIFEEGLKNNAR
jgi:Fe-S-cluster-containing hydrogenase component 2